MWCWNQRTQLLTYTLQAIQVWPRFIRPHMISLDKWNSDCSVCIMLFSSFVGTNVCTVAQPPRRGTSKCYSHQNKSSCYLILVYVDPTLSSLVQIANRAGLSPGSWLAISSSVSHWAWRSHGDTTTGSAARGMCTGNHLSVAMYVLFLHAFTPLVILPNISCSFWCNLQFNFQSRIIPCPLLNIFYLLKKWANSCLSIKSCNMKRWMIQMHICCSEAVKRTRPFHCIVICYKLQMSKEDTLSKEK